jgi:hypothetical protein
MNTSSVTSQNLADAQFVTNPSRMDYEDMKNKRLNHRRAPGACASVAP